VRKADMAKREEKIDKYNRTKGQIAEQESVDED
jgi:hypothetical protein